MKSDVELSIKLATTPLEESRAFVGNWTSSILDLKRESKKDLLEGIIYSRGDFSWEGGAFQKEATHKKLHCKGEPCSLIS